MVRSEARIGTRARSRALELGATAFLVLALLAAGAAGYANWRYHQQLNEQLGDELDGAQNAQRIARLIRRGADVNLHSPIRDTTALAAAVGDLDPSLVESLLQRGSRVSDPGQAGWTPLIYAVNDGDGPDLPRRLLAHGADPNARDGTGYAPLVYAAMENQPEVMRELLAHGAAFGCRDPDGDALLLRAAEQGADRSVAFLVRRGASLAERDSRGAGPLTLAREGRRQLEEDIASSPREWKDYARSTRLLYTRTIRLLRQLGARK